MTVRDERSDAAALVLAEVDALVAQLHGGAHRPLSLDSDLLVEAALDSLALVELAGRLEQAFDVRLPEQVLASAATPRDWLQAVLEARGTRAAPQLAPADERAAGPEPPHGEGWPRSARTLVEALDWHVGAHPGRPCLRILDGDRAGPAVELTYAELRAAAGGVACALLHDGIEPGARVALMLPTGGEYFVTFLGVLLAGAVPVPLYPPARPAQLEEHLRRQARLLSDAGASMLVTVREALLAARLLALQVPSLRALRSPEDLAGGAPAALPKPGPHDVALVQYTSGSTGEPKGVVLTHAQLLANIAAMGDAAAASAADVFVSWLPLYHDMGLIGAWHASLVIGMPLVVLSPLRLLARPASWLVAISQYRGTLSAAPNFAYELCARRVADEEMDGVDLSSWRIAFNGSETVHAPTIERFTSRFARWGFRREAMCPAYGLAEVGVGATFTPIGRGPVVDVVARSALARSGRAVPTRPEDPDARAVVGSGVPLPGYEIRVVDPAGAVLPERRLGEVECRGPSATSGYLRNEAATSKLWHDGWLVTGDLGYLAGGQLFLTGRSKDTVVRGGRNIDPEELEQRLGELEALGQGHVAVLGVPDPRQGTERVVVVAEAEVLEDPASLRAEVASLAASLVGQPVDDVVFVRPGSIPRTASGKIRRSATRDAYEAGALGRAPEPAAVQLLRFAASSLRPALGRLGRAGAQVAFGAFAWSVALALAAATYLLVRLPLPSARRWALARAATRALCRASGIRIETEGELPRESPVVVVANHASFVDGAALLAASSRPLTFVASTELERARLVGGFLRRIGCVFVHRGSPERTEPDLARVAAHARAGASLVVFPEGRLDPAPGIRPFHLGAFAVAASAGCPLVPVGIVGTRAILRPGRLLPRRADVTIRVGRTLPAPAPTFAAEVACRDEARQAIAELSGEALLEASS
ncbi:MAG TPA: AMP-binding protein [Acidimicrobiales bacterium]|nr:AMP-binding protein [Acidimicrobiales bacterium]